MQRALLRVLAAAAREHRLPATSQAAGCAASSTSSISLPQLSTALVVPLLRLAQRSPSLDVRQASCELLLARMRALGAFSSCGAPLEPHVWLWSLPAAPSLGLLRPPPASDNAVGPEPVDSSGEGEDGDGGGGGESGQPSPAAADAGRCLDAVAAFLGDLLVGMSRR